MEMNFKKSHQVLVGFFCIDYLRPHITLNIMTIEKLHHYMPRSYLRSFSNKDGKINQHFKNTDKVHLRSIAKIGCE